MFDTMRIRTKLTVALIIPLVALLVLSGVAIANSRQKADDASAKADQINEQVALATATLGPAGVITTLQEERNAETLDLIGVDPKTLGGKSSPAELRVLNDQAIAAFRADVAKKPQAVQDAYTPGLAALDRVADLRAASDAYTGERSQAAAQKITIQSFDGYSAVIQDVFDANSKVAVALDDANLRTGAGFVDALARYRDQNSVVSRSIGTALTDPNGGGLYADPALITTAVTQNTELVALKNSLLNNSSPVYAALAADLFADPSVVRGEEITKRVLAGEVLPVSVLLSPDVANAQTVADATAAAAGQNLNADATALAQKAQNEADDASSQATLVALITGLVLLAAVGVTLLASRSITRPLARLVGDAEDMASTNLPNTVKDILDAPLGDDVVMPELVPVSAQGGYEIAEVASALNTVQESATGLAVEQAVLRRNISDSFVNLGRRNQNLLSRQLDSITEMERTEADPEVLQKLFTLDHLATRMRRNAESLLLLAGLEPHRQWSAPVALIDVLRGSLGEVEDYDRVVIERLEEATVSGTSAADLTHLIAELVENALNFSPPGRSVEILGKSQNTGYTLAIVDEGIGMEPDDLAQANLRLAGGESFTVAPSRYLGHYVVGIQASRLGVKVQLQPTPTGGVTALIDLTAVLERASDETDSTVTPDADRELSVAGLISESAAARAAAPDTSRETSPLTTTVPDTAASITEDVADVAPLAVTASAPASQESTPVATTASGYKKRVRGANVPRTDVISARGKTDSEVTPSGAAPASTADGMRNLLSGLQAGTERGQAEARAEQDTTNTEEQR